MSKTPDPVWIVDDDESIRWVLTDALASHDITARTFYDAESALEAFENEQPKIIITDVRMEGMGGLNFLNEIQDRTSSIPVIVMTAYSDLDTTIDSFQRGATEYLSKPFDIDDAVSLIQRVMDEANHQSHRSDSSEIVASSMIGESVAMQEVFRAIGRLSTSDLNVLITGESGTGKELVARALYENSVRRKYPFVAINAAAIPVDLLESELFGHEKGAFTGANQRRIGRFEQASRGTLFLDEIGDMPHDLQSRLLRVMSEGKFFRVGGVSEISVDVRVIAATNQDLQALIEQNRFRSDLYHRLNVVGISLPPVRERKGDIERFIQHFMAQAARQLKIEEKTVTGQAMECMNLYHWPGNVREIENVCRSLTVMTPTKAVTINDLPSEIQQYVFDTVDKNTWNYELEAAIGKMLKDTELVESGQFRQAIEQVMIASVLKFCNGSKLHAGKILSWGRNTIARRLNEQ